MSLELPGELMTQTIATIGAWPAARGRLLPIVALVILVALGSACAGATGTAASPKATPTPSAVPATPAASPAAAVATPQTDSWKEFSSDRFGFSFRYPSACEVAENDEAYYVGGRIELAVLDPQGLGLAAFVDRFMDGRVQDGSWRIDNTKSATLGGQAAITVDYRFGGPGRFGTATFTLKGGQIYVWGLTAGGFTCDEPQVYDTVVSSFRFTSHSGTS